MNRIDPFNLDLDDDLVRCYKVWTMLEYKRALVEERNADLARVCEITSVSPASVARLREDCGIWPPLFL
jgi:hypothetical protein